MGAKPDLRLTWSFLTALTDLWAPYPGTYVVHDEASDLIPALAQTCIKALAAEVRESASHAQQGEIVDGELLMRDGTATKPTVRDVANKLVHGSPEQVDVKNGDVFLSFVSDAESNERWVRLRVSARSFLGILYRILYVRPHDSVVRNAGVRALLEDLGPDRFLPTRIGGDESI